MAIKLLSEDDQITVSDADLIKDGDPDTSYTLRKITPKKHREIVKANTRPGNHRREESVNWSAVNEDQIDYLLLSWTGVNDPATNQPAACTRENKLLLDAVRKVELIDRAGMAEVVAAEEARTESFRPSA